MKKRDPLGEVALLIAKSIVILGLLWVLILVLKAIATLLFAV